MACKLWVLVNQQWISLDGKTKNPVIVFLLQILFCRLPSEGVAQM